MRRRAAAIIGVVGELVTTAGVLLGLFVVWQLWWTDVQAQRVQSDVLAQVDWAQPSAAQASAAEGDPPVTAPVAAGELLGLLYVPGWDEAPRTILEGVDKPSVLDIGSAGHYPSTSGPGEIGNFALAGHRTTYGAPFSEVDALDVGDPLVVRTDDTWYVYRVTRWQIVQPWEVGVVAAVPQGDTRAGRYVTLTACHPRFSARERYVVHGELESWSRVADGVPGALAGSFDTPEES